MGLLDRLLVPTDEVKFISQTLAEYRDVRKIYHYDYEPEDLKVLQSCAKDLRPFTWSWVPAGITWYLSGKTVATKGKSMAFRLMVGFSRVMATGQVFRIGYLAGSYQQTTACMRGLVSLPTPLGGEIAALIRSKSPEHPYLKLEQRPPGQEYAEEARPRISTEPNRLAQLAKFKKELDAAKGGQPIRRDAGEDLEGMLQQRQETLSDELAKTEEYKGIDEKVGWGSTGSSSPAGIEQPGRQADDTFVEDVMGMLGSGAWGSEAEEGAESQQKAGQQERRERRRDSWGRLRRRRPEEQLNSDHH